MKSNMEESALGDFKAQEALEYTQGLLNNPNKLNIERINSEIDSSQSLNLAEKVAKMKRLDFNTYFNRPRN